jgi:sugar-specific transcriptional regulator TrmB
MKIQKTLQNLGLEEKETKIYLALLELGSGTIQEIAHKSKVNRTNVYNFIGSMKDKGIISEVLEDNKIILIPENPNVLVKRAEKNYQEIKNTLPELMSIFNLPGNKPKVKFYEGLEGLKKAYNEMLESGEKTIYGFSDYKKMLEAIPEDWAWNFPERRKKNKITFYCIAKNDEWGRKVQAKDQEQLRETRLADKVQFDTEINIYGNKVAMMSFRRPYSAVIIEDRAIAMSMKSIWQGWWGSLITKK